MPLANLVELKVAAGRLRDQADVVELIRHNESQVDQLRRHLAAIHTQYAAQFDELLAQANDPAE
jgi:hypothetical protein